MPKGIKTRSTVKDIKTIDKAANLGGHMKNSFIRSKRSAESTQDTGYHSPTDYASDNVSSRTGGVAQEAAHRVKGKLRHPLQKARNSMERAKEHFRTMRNQTPKARKQAAAQAQKTADTAKKTADTLKTKAEQARKTAEKAKTAVTDAKRTLQQTRQAGRQSVQTARQTAKTGIQAERGIKSSAKTVKATGKGTVKTVKKSVKTAERTAKTAVKTAQRTAKTAQQTAKATAKAARLAVQVSRAAAKAAVVATKATVRATMAMIKAAIAAIQGFVAIIAAGGWVVILIIIIICLIGLLIGSIFGIFFSGEDSGTGRSMPAVVAELTDEFYEKAEDIKSKNTYDVLDESAMFIDWREILAVYAVKVNTDPDNAAEVATLDDDKVDKLRGTLNDMVTLSHSLKTTTQERIITDDDGSETTESISITTLTITLTQKSVDDMAAQYGFSQTQKDQLAELLDPEYDDLWAALLGGYIFGNGELGIPDGSYIPTDIFSWPMGEGFSVSSKFGYRKDPFTHETKYHGGIDISAPTGTPILAAVGGFVTVANSTDSWGGGYGYYVKLTHEGGYSTVYAHCSKIAVKNGQEVSAGEVIAYVGSTGRSTGAHLHFEVWKGGTRTNPLGYFG